MAKPIKETPILKGKDAKKFIEQHELKRESNSNNTSERERILRNYNYFKEAEKSDRNYSC